MAARYRKRSRRRSRRRPRYHRVRGRNVLERNLRYFKQKMTGVFEIQSNVEMGETEGVENYTFAHFQPKNIGGTNYGFNSPKRFDETH